MKTLRIVIHCLPREIDHLERLCNVLRESYYFVPNEINIILDVTLNLNKEFTNWEESTIPKDFFIQKFNNIKQFNDWTFNNLFDIDEEGKCLGINDKRRNSINDDVASDYIMYLDLDVFISNLSLIPLVAAFDSIEDEYLIISAELVRLWDSSWDELVNDSFKTEDHEYFKNIDPFKVSRLTYDNVSENGFGIRKVNSIKFGGGWFNVFSTNLLKFITVPDSLGSYGLDDTFVMFAAAAMKRAGYNINQYVLNGIMCVENNKYSMYDYNPYANFIADKSFENKGRDFKKNAKQQSHENFDIELRKFLAKI